MRILPLTAGPAERAGPLLPLLLGASGAEGAATAPLLPNCAGCDGWVVLLDAASSRHAAAAVAVQLVDLIAAAALVAA